MFPAPWIAPSPPTAATEPDAALEILCSDVVLPEKAELGRRNTFGEFSEGEVAVKNPVRISAIHSESLKKLPDILIAMGDDLRDCQNFSSGVAVRHVRYPKSITAYLLPLHLAHQLL